MDDDLSTGLACRWCRLLGSEGRMVYDDPAFVVVAAPGEAQGSLAYTCASGSCQRRNRIATA